MEINQYTLVEVVQQHQVALEKIQVAFEQMLLILEEVEFRLDHLEAVHPRLMQEQKK